MILIKQSLIILSLLLCCILSLSNAFICNSCDMSDLHCLSGQNVTIRQCENDDDLCYSWFHRTGTELAVQRDCMSITSSEYRLIKEMIGNIVKGCVKHPRTLDCFSYCSDDLCN